MWRARRPVRDAGGLQAALTQLEPAWRRRAHRDGAPLRRWTGGATASLLTVAPPDRAARRCAARRAAAATSATTYPERDDIHWKRTRSSETTC